MSEPTPTPPAPAGDAMFVVDSPYEVARWRPLFNWVLFIPHGIILYALRFVAGLVAIVYWFGLLFTGRLIPGLYGVLAMYERYNQRATSFLLGYTEVYAPFDFNMGGADNGAYRPIRVELPEPPESTPRTAALNFLLAIPHYIVLAVIGVGAAIVAIIAWFAVLFAGAWPRGMRDFLVRYTNYWLRVWAYIAMVHTSYPKFGLSPAA